jgi:putative ABC transport system permease protein
MRFFLSIFAEGLLALSANKFRAFLTMLGIIIGVCAIVAVVSIGDSGKRRVLDEIEKIAQPTMLWVFPNWVYTQKMQKENKPVEYLEYEQFVSVAERCKNYGTIMAQVNNRQRLRYRDKEILTSISGITSAFLDANGLELAEGRTIDDSDQDEQRRICLIGPGIQDELFQGENALGKVLRAGDQRYTVVGILASKGTSFFDWRSYDDRAYIPLGTLVHREPLRRTIYWFVGMAKSMEMIPIFRQRIHEALVEVGMAPEAMESRTLQEETAGFETVSLILKLIVAGVAAISLLVGGLGIMNIMLVTVKERTREIGLRKAIGASSTGIRLQFFVESTLMSAIGGWIGAGAGVGIAHAVTNLLHFPTVISTPAIVWGLIFSALVGILFGIYPAHQAASLDPAEALRYE